MVLELGGLAVVEEILFQFILREKLRLNVLENKVLTSFLDQGGWVNEVSK